MPSKGVASIGLAINRKSTAHDFWLLIKLAEPKLLQVTFYPLFSYVFLIPYEISHSKAHLNLHNEDNLSTFINS